MTSSYKCAHCQETFNEGWSDEEANVEALENFGVVEASKNASMARICDECYKAMKPWLKKQPEYRGPRE